MALVTRFSAARGQRQEVDSPRLSALQPFSASPISFAAPMLAEKLGLREAAAEYKVGRTESTMLPSWKTIEYRGGLVTFRIPSDWVEEYEADGGGAFYAEKPDSGTLRLNVNTLRSPSPIDARNDRGTSAAAGSVPWLVSSSLAGRKRFYLLFGGCRGRRRRSRDPLLGSGERRSSLSRPSRRVLVHHTGLRKEAYLRRSRMARPRDLAPPHLHLISGSRPMRVDSAGWAPPNRPLQPDGRVGRYAPSRVRR